MGFLSVKEVALRFNISERRIQKLCETNRIPGCTMVSGVWLIPNDVDKPIDARLSILPTNEDVLTLSEVCKLLSISTATGRNWIKLRKLIPKYNDKKTPYFEKTYVDFIINDLKKGTNNSLKSRRNKKFTFGNFLYKSYVSEKCQNLFFVQTLLDEIKNQKIYLTEDIISYFIADCAIHFIISRNGNNFLYKNTLFEDYLSGAIKLKENNLIDALISNKRNALDFVKKYPTLFSFDYFYEPNEDVLGLIYISCKNIGNRKATGAYYTPTKIVKSLISSLLPNENMKLLDPCCGTGNFLIQLPNSVPFSNIYGIDIDPISVRITRINMALKYPIIPECDIISHFSEIDYLANFAFSDFSIILGNPPWGYNFLETQKKILKEKYQTARKTNVESFNLFIEQSLNLLQEGGQLSFVLPEAILNVKTHLDIRKIILNNTNIKEIKYLGNVFDGVQCPSIILRLEKNKQKHSTIGMLIDDGTRNYIIKTKRALSSNYFSFLTDDEEYYILEKIKKTENCTYLLNNAVFALGIVTGDNKMYISNEKNEDNEIVLKGSDIYKYKIKSSQNFISFQPENFQQVAPIEIYRCKEKLFYRFISNQLIFAYDDKQILSLNSANILIPKIENMNIKYIMCILNSRIAQFLFKKEFNSIKVLRSHIESIPIPIVNSGIQDEFISIVNQFITDEIEISTESLYDELDDKVCKLFNLSLEEQYIIKKAVDVGNKFLRIM